MHNTHKEYEVNKHAQKKKKELIHAQFTQKEPKHKRGTQETQYRTFDTNREKNISQNTKTHSVNEIIYIITSDSEIYIYIF